VSRKAWKIRRGWCWISNAKGSIGAGAKGRRREPWIDVRRLVGADVTDKVVVITGGSRGIGRATALAAAARGFRVVVGYASNEAAAKEVVASIERKNGKAIAVKCDVGSEADILALFAAADEFGTLGALVNNAGIVGPSARVEDMSAERIQRMMAVNVTGSILCAREAVKRMSTRKGGEGGVIVNLSSVAAKLGSPNTYVDYAASKGAVDSFTVGLGHEVAGEGIRVAAIRPGLIDTEIHASGGEPDRAHRLAHMVPMQRVGTADEIANAIVWLMSDEASYVTSAILDVSGGR
jgi:NAD(P)-dependent dehydrogenase (short-subunit alcohol dehydrogenase family)